MKNNKLNLNNLEYSKSLDDTNFTKRHNLNLGFFEESFYIHDYEYFICSQLYKNYLLTKDINFKNEWRNHKTFADNNLLENIYKQYSLPPFRWWFIPSFIISFMIYFYFNYFGKKRSITYGRKTKVFDSNFSSNKDLIMNIDDMRKKYNKK